MGNTVCTDVKPYRSLDDFRLAKESFPGCTVVDDPSIFTPRSLQSFSGYQHNIKALCFCSNQRVASKSAAGGELPARNRNGISEGVETFLFGSTEKSKSASSSSLKGTRRRIGSAGGKATEYSQHRQADSHKAGPSEDESEIEEETQTEWLTSRVAVEPVNLASRDGYVDVDNECVYLVLHVSRNSSNSSVYRDARDDSAKTQRTMDVDQFGNDGTPPWTEGMLESFTPRGVALTYSTDMGMPRAPTTDATAAGSPTASSRRSLYSSGTPRLQPGTLNGSGSPRRSAASGRSSSRQSPDEFRYSIHLLTGRKAHPLVAAVALLQANQLERMVTNDEEFLRRLFYNLRVTMVREKNAAAPCTPAPLGNIRFQKANGGGAFESRGTNEASTVPNALPYTLASLRDMYGKNSLLRVIHHVRSTPTLPPITAQRTGSSNGSFTSPPTVYANMVSPPPSISLSPSTGPLTKASPATPRIGFGSPSTLPTPSTSAFSMQGKPSVFSGGGHGTGVSIPSLRLAAVVDGNPVAVDQVLNAPRRSTAYTPSTTFRDGGDSSCVTTTSNTSRLTPRTPSGRRMVGVNLTDTNGQGGVSAAETMPPTSKVPIIANLRLAETMPLKNSSGDYVHRTKTNWNDASPRSYGAEGDLDELRMTEERMQKLKAQSPIATEVLPWLFVGGEEAAKDRTQLIEKGITTVVNTVAFSVSNFHDDVFTYLSLYLCDSPDEPIFSLFPLVVRHIDEARAAGGKVLVHCHQGASRSCSFVIAYVMWSEGLCYDRAYEKVRAKRTICSPNSGFHVNLLVWETHLSTPTLNRAYAFAPYTEEFLFPFSYKLALAFRNAQTPQSHSRDELLVQRYARVVSGNDASIVFDERLCYGMLLYNGVQQPPRSYFYCSPHVEQIVVEKALEEWKAFIKYNYYQGKHNSSLNNHGEAVVFSPTHTADVEVISIRSDRDLQSTLLNSVSQVSTSGKKSGQSQPVVRVSHDSRWNKLMTRENFLFTFAAHLAEQDRVQQQSSQRKRTREEEHRRAQQRKSDLQGKSRHPVSASKIRTPIPHSPRHAAATESGMHGGKRHGSPENRITDSPLEKRLRLNSPEEPIYSYSPRFANSSTDGNKSSASQKPILSKGLSTSVHRLAIPSTVAPKQDSGSARREASPPQLALRSPRVGSNGGSKASAAPEPRRTSHVDINSSDATGQQERRVTSLKNTAPVRQGVALIATRQSSRVVDDAVTYGVEVYEYPFESLNQDILSVDDLATDGCYCILIPGNNEGNRPHKVYLWLGAECELDEDEVLNAFDEHLRVTWPSAQSNSKKRVDSPEETGVVLSNGSVMVNVDAEIAIEGEEPNELLLALD